MSIKKSNQNGFTLIELMIATTVLATMLVLIATISIQIGRLFYKGVSSSRTQETARAVSDQISRSIQYGGDNPIESAGVICVGGSRYSYQTNISVDKEKHALWVDEEADSCTSAPDLNTETPTTSGKELIPRGMRLTKFNIVSDATRKYWEIEVGVGLGDNDLFQYAVPGDESSEIIGCVGTNKGGQFCDVAELKVGVYRWL